VKAFHLLSRWFVARFIFFTLKMEAICASKMSVDFQWNTRRYIPGNKTLQPTYSLMAFIYRLLLYYFQVCLPSLSMALQSFAGPWQLLQFIFTLSVGLLGRGISQSQGRYLHTGEHK
jgi:hypothetical protein